MATSSERGPERKPLGPTGEQVRANFARLRSAQGLSHQELADRIATRGLSRSALSNVERGERRVDVDDLMRICIALGAGPLELLFPPHANETDLVDISGDRAVPLGFLWWWGEKGGPIENETQRRQWALQALKEWQRQLELERHIHEDKIDRDAHTLRLLERLSEPSPSESLRAELESTKRELRESIDRRRVWIDGKDRAITLVSQRLRGLETSPEAVVDSIQDFVMELHQASRDAEWGRLNPSPREQEDDDGDD